MEFLPKSELQNPAWCVETPPQKNRWVDIRQASKFTAGRGHGLRSEGLNNRTQSGRAGQRRRRRDLNSHRRRQAAHWATLFHFPSPPPELLWFVEGRAKMKRQGIFNFFFSWSSFKKNKNKKTEPLVKRNQCRVTSNNECLWIFFFPFPPLVDSHLRRAPPTTRQTRVHWVHIRVGGGGGGRKKS